MQDHEARRRELYGLLGDLPERDRPIGGRSLGPEERRGYTLERLLLDLNGVEAVPAYFLRPPGATGPLPTILYHHAHGGDFVLGKDEVTIGRPHLQAQPYAEALTARGYAVLALDAWGFGERRGRTESELFKAMLWRGQVLWGMMVYDNIRSIDYLATRSDVDLSRLATLGLSIGSTMAWWLADFQALIDMQLLDRHGLYYYVPSLLKRFDTAGINALIAPRPHLGLAGNFDRLTLPAGLDRIDRALHAVYAAHGAVDAWELRRFETGHFETAAMRVAVLDWLARWL